MEQLGRELAVLTSSPFYDYRTKNQYLSVLGEGDLDAKLMFVGEAPGENEAKTGRPFCGAAGRILNELLASINLPRESVYITNVVKDRPPGNRDPLPDEVELYSPFLERQLEIIQPQVVIALGRISMAYLMTKFGLADKLAPISKLHGRAFRAKTASGQQIWFVALYPPAVATYRASQKQQLLDDFQVLKRLLEGQAPNLAGFSSAPFTPPKPKQKGLF